MKNLHLSPEEFTLEPNWDGTLSLIIGAQTYNLPITTARILNQKLITEIAKIQRLVIPEKCA